MGTFHVFAGKELVGYSDLEAGDPPMGIASGKLRVLPSYEGIRAACVAAREASQSHLELSVRRPNGEPLPAELGVAILDFSAELGPEAIEVHALGIGYPLYGELFPEHVAAYAKQFG